MKLKQEIQSDVENVDTELCTKSEREEVSFNKIYLVQRNVSKCFIFF